MAKGASFERKIATELSLWWTLGKYDDTIWRSSMSGGRATVRNRKGMRTTGHYGDLCSTGKESASLFRMFAFELKCGYQHVTINDLLDRPANAAFQKDGWDGWIQQASQACRMSESVSWMIIHQRSRGKKRAMAYLDIEAIEATAPLVYEDLISRQTTVMIDTKIKKVNGKLRYVSVMGVPLANLLAPGPIGIQNSFRDAVLKTVKRVKKWV